MNSNIKHIYFLLLFLLLESAISGQPNFLLNKKGGLPSNRVYQINQSSDYYLWLTTDLGVVRYDGSELIEFNKNNGLKSRSNLEIVNVPDKGLLFLGENGKISRYQNEKFVKEEKDSMAIEFNQLVSEYIHLSDGREAAASFGDGIKIKTERGILHLTEKNGLLNNFVSFIWEQNNCIYAISRKGISKISKDYTIETVIYFEGSVHYARAVKNEIGEVFFTGREKLFRFDRSEKLSVIGNGIDIIEKVPTRLQYIDGKYIASTYKGVHFFRIEDNEVIVENSFLENKEVSSVVKDHEGSFWLSTLNSGVIKLRQKNVETIVANTQVNCIYNDSGSLLFGLKDMGYGMYFNGKVEYHKLQHKNLFASQKVQGITKFYGQRWFETDGGIASFNGKVTYHYRTGRAKMVLYRNQIYIGNKTGLYRLNSLQELDVLKDNGVNSILLKEFAEVVTNEAIVSLKVVNGILYVASEKALYKMKNGELKGPIINAALNPVLDLITQGDEQYIISKENGLLYVDSGNTYFIGKEQGLSSNYCTKAMRYGQYLIVSSTSGINIVRNSSLKSTRIDNKVLLLNEVVNDFTVIKGKLYVASNTGFYAISNFTKGSPPFLIPLQEGKVFVNNTLIANSKLKTLTHNENNLSIRFDYISFGGDRVKKYYRINGGDWNTFDGAIQFNEMAYGKYILELKAESGLNSSDIRLYNFQIMPPWWSTMWFRILIVAVIVLLVYIFFKVRILTYNRDIVKELLLVLLVKIKGEKHILVKNVEDGSNTKIKLSQLLYLKSDRNYTQFVSKDDQVTTRMTLSDAMRIVIKDARHFSRCHRSFVVNVRKVSAFHGEFIKINGKRISVGNKYRESFKEKWTKAKGP